jgi:hypothetical protein
MPTEPTSDQPSEPPAPRVPAWPPLNHDAPLDAPSEGIYPLHHAPEDRGEADVWRSLGRQRPAGWLIWHHLVVGRSFHQAEIDFAVAVPGRGVVLIEVKAGQMTRRDGLWFQNGHLLRPQPGEQIERARKSLLFEFQRRYGANPPAEVAVALCFPETHGDGYARAGGPPILFREDLKWFEAGGNKRLLDAFSGRRYPDDPRFLGALHAIWGPDWWPLPTLTRAPSRADSAWRQLTAEQLTVLTCLDRSPRLLIQGPPGSGKTVLLMAIAERMQAEGVPTTVFTFTKAIASELSRAGVRDVQPIRELAVSLARGWGLIAPDADPATWRSAEWNALLDAVVARLREEGPRQSSALLLVDEYQDLGAIDWQMLEALAQGDTRVWLFGDDEQRALVHAKGARVPPSLAPGGVFRLRAGLRCPASLLALATRVLRGESPSEALPAAGELEQHLRLVTLPSDADAETRLRAASEVVSEELARLADKLRPEDVAVLSFGSKLASRVQTVPELGGRPARRADDEPLHGAVLSDTVLRAKGLERPLVVLTDLDLANAEGLPRLFYLGLTRASWRCVVIGTASELGPLA